MLDRIKGGAGEPVEAAGSSVAAGGGRPGHARRDARNRIVTFLVPTLLFTAVSASLAIGIGTQGDAGELIGLGVVWSPGLAPW